MTKSQIPIKSQGSNEQISIGRYGKHMGIGIDGIDDFGGRFGLRDLFAGSVTGKRNRRRMRWLPPLAGRIGKFSSRESMHVSFSKTFPSGISNRGRAMPRGRGTLGEEPAAWREQEPVPPPTTTLSSAQRFSSYERGCGGSRPCVRDFSFTFRLLCLVTLFSAAGCNILGPVGAVTGRAFPPTIDASYKGLAQQSVAVIVWADRGIRIDNPNLQLDIASGIEEKLRAIQTDEKPKELEGTRFPVRPDSVARFQEDHPEMEFQPITETAGKFNSMFKTSRLIYIEITDFSTRSEASLSLHLGNITGNIKVLEMSDGKAKEAFKESDIHVSFPKDSPPEGLPIGTDYKIYQGTLDLFTTQLSQRLYAHKAEDN